MVDLLQLDSLIQKYIFHTNYTAHIPADISVDYLLRRPDDT